MAISGLCSTSVSKHVLVHNFSYGKEFDFQDGKRASKTRFQMKSVHQDLSKLYCRRSLESGPRSTKTLEKEERSGLLVIEPDAFVLKPRWKTTWQWLIWYATQQQV